MFSGPITSTRTALIRDLSELFARCHSTIGTFRSEDEDDHEYEFSVLSMRIRFEGRHFSKCAFSEQKTRTRSRPRPPI